MIVGTKQGVVAFDLEEINLKKPIYTRLKGICEQIKASPSERLITVRVENKYIAIIDA